MSHADRVTARPQTSRAITSRPLSRLISRRAMLGLLTVAAGGVLSACVSAQPTAAPKATEPPKPAEAAKPAAQPAAPAAQPAATAAPAAAAKPAESKPAEAAKPAEASKPAAAAPAVSKKLGGELRLHMRTGSEEDTLKEVLP